MVSTCTLTLQENNFCNDKVSLQTPSLQHPNIFAIKFIYMHLLCKPTYFFMRKFINYKEYHILQPPTIFYEYGKKKGENIWERDSTLMTRRIINVSCQQSFGNTVILGGRGNYCVELVSTRLTFCLNLVHRIAYFLCKHSDRLVLHLFCRLQLLQRLVGECCRSNLLALLDLISFLSSKFLESTCYNFSCFVIP